MSALASRIALLLLTAFAPLSAALADTRTAAIPDGRQLPPPSKVAPDKGVFLVARPSMQDPRFQETVVLLLAHSEQGTLGLIINRPTEIRLSHALPDLDVPEKEQPLFFGGPVAMNLLVFLIRSAAPPEQATHVMADVYYSADKDTLQQLLVKGKQGKELRMFIGHAGWGPGQLAGEIARGDWLLLHADPQTVFEKNLQNIWRELMDRRPTPGMFIELPVPLPAHAALRRPPPRLLN